MRDESGDTSLLTSVQQPPGVAGLLVLEAVPLPAELLHVVRPLLSSLAAGLPCTEAGVGHTGHTGGRDQDIVPGVPGVLCVVCVVDDSVGGGVGGHHGVVDGGQHAVVWVCVV